MTETKDGVWVYGGVEFQVGDTVQIWTNEEDCAPHGMGHNRQWDNKWVDEMDYAIGGVHEIEYICDAGVAFVEYVDYDGLHPHQGYLYPLSSLVKM